jgi:hypothetical protein
MANEKTLVDTIKAKQDIGSYEPLFKRVELQLWSDGSVTWTQLEQQNAGNGWQYETVATADASATDE